MYFEEIQAALDQPRGYLQSIIDSICDSKKENGKTLYFLKPMYLNSAADQNF